MVKSGFLVAAVTCVLLFASSNQVNADDQAKCKCENDFTVNTQYCCQGLYGEYREGGNDCLFPTRDPYPQSNFLGCCREKNLNAFGDLEDSEHFFGQCGD
ncbi:hypothetical protein BDC45DRAFT_603044 [Circinella umbellata]|nr:hypothetical protein BDC45DRAFT_603044 [Circinella umbellata]